MERSHDYATEWKSRTGRKVFGYFCTYVPEEIIYAAGILPVRVLGRAESQDQTDVHIPTFWCPHSRDCLAQGLMGRYKYLDGIVSTFCCQHMRQVYFSWKRHTPVSFAHELYLPIAALQGRNTVNCYAGELRGFIRLLQDGMGVQVPTESLDRAIEVYNTNRSLLRELYELRKAAVPPLWGFEALYAVLSSMVMDKAEHSQLLRQLLRELAEREDVMAEGPRLMILGSPNYNLELVKLIESTGAVVVVDENCMGSTYFMEKVVSQEDRIQALAERYCNRLPCPQRDFGTPASPKRRRPAYTLELALEYNVQGVIFIQQKFCDPHAYDAPTIMSLLKENGIDTLLLEVDVTTPVGQLRTRLEAFLEILQLDLV